MLEIKSINTYYNNIHVLRDVSLHIKAGSLTALLGVNGAGKSTLLRTISGILKPRSGDLLFNGNSIKNLSTRQIVGLGISHVPEGRHIFPRMTVLENLELGGYLLSDSAAVSRSIEEAFNFFPVLYDRRKQLAGTLSGGEQQMLAISRGLILRPRLLLLDEPSMGLAPKIMEEIIRIIDDINKKGMTILLIEQNAKVALEVSHFGYVLETGSVVLSGTAGELINDSRVKKAYLGM